MQWFEKQKLDTVAAGTFLNMASHVSVEIAANTGFDWLLLDFEHGSGGLAQLRPLLLACRGAKAAPIVRLRSVDPDAAKFVLDSGAAGVMFPFVSTAEQARAAVEVAKYPPLGRRGVAGIIRATEYGEGWHEYQQQANAKSLVIVQIETPEAVDAADEIASVEGVDVLFVGPLDLSGNMGCPGDYSPPNFVAALQHVIDACRRNGKAPGILSRPEFTAQHLKMGFRFFALGSDAGAVVSGMRQNLSAIRGR